MPKIAKARQNGPAKNYKIQVHSKFFAHVQEMGG